MAKHILAIDVGTTSIRGILYDEAGRAKGMESVKTPLLFRGDFIEQSAKTYDDALTAICRALCREEQPDAVTLTAFRSAPALVDEEGRALTNFIMWQDTRNREICERLLPENDRVFRTTGAGINAVFTASKITWFKENEAPLYERAYKALIVPDYLMCRMTGKFHTDVTYGSRTSLMNIESCSWDKGMCDLFSLAEEKLPALIPQGSIYGHVTEAFAKESTLPAGIPVITAGGDQQCGALGLGALDETSLVINCGTGSFLIGLTDAPFLQTPSMICNVAAVRGKYILESNILSSAAGLDWFLRELMPDLCTEGKADFARFTEIASSSPAGANGVVCVPLFTGCGTRDWNPEARASFTGMSLNHTRADLSRAVLEGIAAEIAKSIPAFPGSLKDAPRAGLGGGMTRSDLFAQILADMTGKELIRYDDGEATAIGAFLSACVTLGLHPDERAAFAAVREQAPRRVFVPDPAKRKTYDALIAQTETVYRSLSS
ncbi:MAG: hypothetical protein IJR00_01075 [Lachnospiraceae bacterium]|nr:hypothetical protein [Lachnospiraceae bacterium]